MVAYYYSCRAWGAMCVCPDVGMLKGNADEGLPNWQAGRRLRRKGRARGRRPRRPSARAMQRWPEETTRPLPRCAAGNTLG